MANNRTYEEFEPYCKWQKGENEDILEVHVHGFKKHHLKVMVNNAGLLTVAGERPLEGTKWCRFRREIKVPKDTYKNDDVHAKLCGGILYITMPKTTPQQKPKFGEDKVALNSQSQDFGAITTDETVKGTSYLPGLQSSTPRLVMSKRTAMKVAVASAVVVAVGLGAYAIYKFTSLLM